MKVSIVQMDVKLADPAFNFTHAEELIRRAAKGEPDVIFLPETWNTGFFPKINLAECCDHEGQQTKQRIGGLAAELRVNIVAGSASDLRGDGVYNTALIFDRKGGLIAQYDKTHLFTPSGEQDYYQSGSSLCTFELDGKRCGIIICYDIRFPELTRTLALSGIDVLFVPAQWPAARRYHWDTLVAARAIENQIYIAACNSCSADTKMGGSSRLIDPWGEVLAKAGEGEEIISGDFDFSIIEKIRSTINVYRDRRPDVYKLL